jgi:hypothetical protein
MGGAGRARLEWPAVLLSFAGRQPARVSAFRIMRAKVIGAPVRPCKQDHDRCGISYHFGRGPRAHVGEVKLPS